MRAIAPDRSGRNSLASVAFARLIFAAALVTSTGIPHVANAAPESESKRESHKIAMPQPNNDIEADVSTRSIAITSGFSGTKIIVFGAVNHPYKIAPLNEKHNVIVSIEGLSKPLIARQKTNVLGVWVNTDAMRFDSAPSFYAVAATKPISEIATDEVLERHDIGVKHLKILPASTSQQDLAPTDVNQYKSAVIRLKQQANLYQTQESGVIFLGRSLFRSEFELPANVPVGPLKASVFLFRHGELVSQFTSRVELRREGLQLYLYDLAYNHSLIYGVMAVVFAVVAGLSASAIFGRKTH